MALGFAVVLAVVFAVVARFCLYVCTTGWAQPVTAFVTVTVLVNVVLVMVVVVLVLSRGQLMSSAQLVIEDRVLYLCTVTAGIAGQGMVSRMVNFDIHLQESYIDMRNRMLWQELAGLPWLRAP